MHIVWPFALCTYYNAWHAWMRRRWQLGVVVPCALLCVLNFTVAILAQGTYWAVASLQAFLHPPHGMRALRGGTWWRHPQHCKPCSWRRPPLDPTWPPRQPWRRLLFLALCECLARKHPPQLPRTSLFSTVSSPDGLREGFPRSPSTGGSQTAQRS